VCRGYLVRQEGLEDQLDPQGLEDLVLLEGLEVLQDLEDPEGSCNLKRKIQSYKKNRN
jgi:hypothetical protein